MVCALELREQDVFTWQAAEDRTFGAFSMDWSACSDHQGSGAGLATHVVAVRDACCVWRPLGWHFGEWLEQPDQVVGDDVESEHVARPAEPAITGLGQFAGGLIQPRPSSM